MKSCLPSQRPFQLGCRRITNRYGQFHPSFARYHLTPARRSNIKNVSYARQYTTIDDKQESASRKPRSYQPASVKDQQKESQHKVDDSNIEATWIQLLEPYLPADLRDGRIKDNLNPNEQPGLEGENISSIIRRARQSHNLDLLAYLGFTLQRWPAVYALITKMVVAADELHSISFSAEVMPSNILWIPARPPRPRKWRSTKVNPRPYLARGFQNASTFISTEAFTDEPRHSRASLAIMGEVWQSLGFIVLAAADKTTSESQLAMSYVYRTLARLHESGNISDALYKYTSQSDNGNSYRPPGMYLLSTHIMNVLSDAAWLVHEAEATERAKAAGEDPPYRPFKMGIRHLGPQIWLEFILWACVEQGLTKEGLWILKHLKGSNYGTVWKIVSWDSLLNRPDLINATNIDTEDFWPHPDIPRTPEELQNKSGYFHGLGKSIISAEVFTALTKQAASYVNTDLQSAQQDDEDLIEQLALVMKMKQSHAAKAAAGLFNGSHYIVPILESQISKAKIQPEWMDRVVNALPLPMPPWDDSVPSDYPALNALEKHDICNTSSILTGLLQQNIRLYSKDQRVEKAIKSFNSLLEIIDSSKMKRIELFWEKEKEILRGKTALSSHTKSLPEASAAIEQPSIPSLSNGILADLLDLARVSKAYDFGRWLLFSEDPDGPIVSLDSYSDQSLVPSLLRFAAATNNESLGNLAIRRLQRPITRNTFNAIANFYIAFEKWDDAESILDLLTQYRRKSWGETTVASLTSFILRLEHRIWEKPGQQRLEESLSRAQMMLRSLLSGEYDPQRVFNESVQAYYKKAAHRWHGLLLTIPGAVAQVASSVEPAYTNILKRDKLPFIPCTAFNLMLSAVVETRGSQVGMEMWKTWCMDIEPSHTVRVAQDEMYRLKRPLTSKFEDLDIEFDWAWHFERQNKAVVPNLNTLRIISRAAVMELKQSQEAAPDKKSLSPFQQEIRDKIYNVLDFCVERYQRFNRDKHEIGRETGGHLKRIRMWQSRKRKNIIRWVDADFGQEFNDEAIDDLLADKEDKEWETFVGR